MSELEGKLAHATSYQTDEQIIEGMVKEMRQWLKEGRRIMIIGALTGEKAANNDDKVNPLIRVGMTCPPTVGLTIAELTAQMLKNHAFDIEGELAEADQKIELIIHKDDTPSPFNDVKVNEAHITKYGDKGPIFDSLQEVIDDLRIRNGGFILLFQTAENGTQIESNTPVESIPTILRAAVDVILRNKDAVTKTKGVKR